MNKPQLKQLIKEEVQKIQRRNILENRKKQINEEFDTLNGDKMPNLLNLIWQEYFQGTRNSNNLEFLEELKSQLNGEIQAVNDYINRLKRGESNISGLKPPYPTDELNINEEFIQY